MTLEDIIRFRTARIGVVGLGYVGLAEALEFAGADFNVNGFDTEPQRVEAVNRGRSCVSDISDYEMTVARESGRLRATHDLSTMRDMHAIVICVPTPLSKTRAPDASGVVRAVEALAPHLRSGQLVVLEGTLYPGTTSEVVLPALEATGLKVGRDFFLCFSPERLNPGDKDFPAHRIPRVVGGVTGACTSAGMALFAMISPEVVRMSSPQAAEMVTFLENAFRAVNIALVNELALMSRLLRLDVWEVIDAAATKPFGFMPFYPGPGFGGHGLSADPLDPSWPARAHLPGPSVLAFAQAINGGMPSFVVAMVVDVLNERGRSVRGSTVLVLGAAYKRDVNDARESPAVDIILALRRRGATVLLHDPYVPALDVGGERFCSVPLDDDVLTAADVALIVTDHSDVDYKRVVDRARAVIDTRNATRGVVQRADNIYRL